MLEIGKESYVDVSFTDSYIGKYYPDYSPIAVHWSVLTDKEKEGYLLSSMEKIEALPYTGRKYDISQNLEFPRVVNSSNCIHYPFTAFRSSAETPEAIKIAQIENALGIIQNEISSISEKQFKTMQTLGLVKNTKYKKSEAGEVGYSEALTGGVAQKKIPLISEKAYKLLKQWIGGGYKC